MLNSFLLDPLRRIDEDARAASGPLFDGRSWFVLVYAALALTLQRYLCLTSEIHRTLDALKLLGVTIDFPLGPRALAPRVWWSVGTFLLWCVIPALLGRLVLKMPPADFGLKLKGAFTDGWVYLGMFAIVGPLVPLVAQRPSFLATYPFYTPAPGLGWDFWAWEACYALQFLAVEFFFRGWLIHGLKHRLGSAAIPVMTIPYVMIHFGKPLTETLGSIIAGLALGFMSLRTRSIVMGAVLHVAVAISMDLSALYQKGYFD